MNNFISGIAYRIVRVGRRLFFHTPLGSTKIANFAVRTLFKLYSPDLSSPIPFRSIKLFVDKKDRSYVPSVVGGYYEKLELDIFSELAKESITFFDIGANIGMYSLIANKSNSKIRSFAFEPTPDNIALIKRNVKLNNAKKVSVIESAVSNKVGTADISLGPTGSGTNSLSINYGGEMIHVATITVDSFCKKNKTTPDLMKVDVEGHENQVLIGAKNILKTTKMTVLIEYIPKMNKDIHLITDHLSSISKDCYIIDDIRGSVRKVLSSDLDRSESYNLIFSNNKKHLKILDAYVSK